MKIPRGNFLFVKLDLLVLGSAAFKALVAESSERFPLSASTWGTAPPSEATTSGSTVSASTAPAIKSPTAAAPSRSAPSASSRAGASSPGLGRLAALALRPPREIAVLASVASPVAFASLELALTPSERAVAGALSWCLAVLAVVAAMALGTESKVGVLAVGAWPIAITSWERLATVILLEFLEAAISSPLVEGPVAVVLFPRRLASKSSCLLFFSFFLTLLVVYVWFSLNNGVW